MDAIEGVVTHERVEKAWGETRCHIALRNTEVWHASIKKGGYSSRHWHRAKENHFYVVSGELRVITFPNKIHPEPGETFTLTAGQGVCIPWGRKHQFEAATDVELIETYLGRCDPDDIERSSSGGIE